MLGGGKVALLSAVHTQVLAIFLWVPDAVKFGETEHWMTSMELADLDEDGFLRGDCDDFALKCRDMLDAEGIENRLVYCIMPGLGPHLVLEVDGWVLCNMQRSICRRNDLDYQWLIRSGPKKDDPWHRITD